MAQAARDYLAIPSSEADIERLFSLGRDILGIQRFSMGMDTMRALVLLKDALKATGDSSKRQILIAKWGYLCCMHLFHYR